MFRLPSPDAFHGHDSRGDREIDAFHCFNGATEVEGSVLVPQTSPHASQKIKWTLIHISIGTNWAIFLSNSNRFFLHGSVDVSAYLRACACTYLDRQLVAITQTNKIRKLEKKIEASGSQFSWLCDDNMFFNQIQVSEIIIKLPGTMHLSISSYCLFRLQVRLLYIYNL
jgi:hypothetical protein